MDFRCEICKSRFISDKDLKNHNSRKHSVQDKNSNAVLYGLLSGLALIFFYLGTITIFQGFSFALINLRSLWYLIFPLVIGFGTQIGLFISIRHKAKISGRVVGATGTISGGSMVACCSHFLLNMIPIVGASGLAIFLVKYQSLFLVFGIISNIAGITLLLKHKKNMSIDGGSCHDGQ